MARRRGLSTKAIEVIEGEKTNRSLARWDGLKRVLPAFFASASPVALGLVEAHAPSGPEIVNIVLIVLMIVGVPSALAKIAYDGRQKQRLRERITNLEQENSRLTAEAGSRRERRT